ncbi:hypothetical protein C8R47DRAFT_1069924 [Mycena vitilis]|nr:hypothetical protein C8R47DRAFT_1069924 [Mycena vitilis]
MFGVTLLEHMAVTETAGQTRWYKACHLKKAAIISTCLEGILYGFSLLMFVATLWILVVRKANGKIPRNMVVVSSLLMLMSSLHIGCDIWRLYQGFIVLPDIYPGGPASWFANERDPSFLFKHTPSRRFLGMIYRCYMVWKSVPVIVLPVLLSLGFCTTAIGALYEMAQVAPTSEFIYAQRTAQWVNAFYAHTFACNLVASGILAYKLWTVGRNVQTMRVGKNIVKPVLATIIDAGALYSAALIVAIVGFALKSNVQYIMLDITVPIISIAFFMVILRVAIASAGGVVSSFQRMPLPRGPRSNNVNMQVHIEQFVENDHAGKTHDTGSSDELFRQV